MMVVFGLIVLTLVAYGARSEEPAEEPAADAGAGAPAAV